MDKKVRLRYAPSPTGFLHIGNTRTALFNYLLAKHYNGNFVLRIEDTDIERNVDKAIESQLDNLRWMGIIPDETVDLPGEYGPYNQLSRLDIYQQYANRMLENKRAYYCFCTAEQLEDSREQQLAKGYASPRYDRKCFNLTQEEVEVKLKNSSNKNIRFAVPNNTTFEFNDLVRGKVQFESKDMGDWVIMKSNGIPTYNFAVVIDDVLMKITHVVRGEEHISNTPKQLMIYNALNEIAPIFAHLTLIVNEQRKKLSKRDNDVVQFISQYRELGYLSDAVFNFIALLGWCPKTEQEFFSKTELIEQFDETRFSKSPSMFDVKKLNWMNNHYIKMLSDQQYYDFCNNFIIQKYDISNKEKQWIEILINIYKKELEYGSQINDLIKPFFEDIIFDDNINLQLKELNCSSNLIVNLENAIEDLKQWNEANIKQLISDIGNLLAIKGKNLFMPIRIYTTKQSHGAELSKVIWLYGKEKVLANINYLIGEANEKN